MSTEKYAVYLIIYSGNKLSFKSKNSLITPRRYIGSSKLSNISNGYLGSVASKKYSKIWLKETRENPALFKLRILSIHDDDVLAREEEKRLQIKYDVVKSDLYVNLSLASPNGYFGKPDIGRKFSDETKEKMAISNSIPNVVKKRVESILKHRELKFNKILFDKGDKIIELHNIGLSVFNISNKVGVSRYLCKKIIYTKIKSNLK